MIFISHAPTRIPKQPLRGLWQKMTEDEAADPARGGAWVDGPTNRQGGEVGSGPCSTPVRASSANHEALRLGVRCRVWRSTYSRP